MENDDEVERRRKRNKWVSMYHAMGDQARDDLRDFDTVNYYLLEGLYHNGETVVPVQMAGSSLEECVQKLKDADPNFGLGELTFTGGWVCADYDVTRQVRELV